MSSVQAHPGVTKDLRSRSHFVPDPKSGLGPISWLMALITAVVFGVIALAL